MCPHGYHHSGSMATPALGTRDVRLIYIYIIISSYLYMERPNWFTYYIALFSFNE